MRKQLTAVALLAALGASHASAQQTPTADPSTVIPEKIEPMPRGTPPVQSRESSPPLSGAQAQVVGLPEGCRRAAAMAGNGDMPMHGAPSMQDRQPTAQMTDTQRALVAAMDKMRAGMMQGMAVQDGDVAWICAMIPHHQGAIDMARAGLLTADNAESRQMAEETIRMQQQEIARLTRWVQQHAERESRRPGEPPLAKP